MATCKLCDAKIATTFLGKILGTIIYDNDHKQQHICSNCQKEHKNDAELKAKINK